MTFDVGFMQKFLQKLDNYNKSCENHVASAENEHNELIKRLEERKKQLHEKQRGHVRASASAKNNAVQKYESGLQSSDQQDKRQFSSVYANLSQTKIAIAKGSGGSQSEVQQLSNTFLSANKAQSQQSRDKLWGDYQAESEGLQQSRNKQQQDDDREKSKSRKELSDEYDTQSKRIYAERDKRIKSETDKFISEFSPTQIERAFVSIQKREPFVETFTQEKFNDNMENPAEIKVASFSYGLSSLGLKNHAKALLDNYYPMLYRQEQLIVPLALAFDENFNFLFEINASTRQYMIERACSLALRLFMLVPPTKIHFTFIDPVTLGESFSLFSNVVDDQTRTVINGQVWSTAEDIDGRLQTLTEHVSNVTQRYLKGKYKTIQEFNAIAAKNAVPYQILMIMDFPANFKEDSLRKLEQIISTGPKCGVYTIIVKNNDQVPRDENKRIDPLIKNIEKRTTYFRVVPNSENGGQFVLAAQKEKAIDGYADNPIGLTVNRLLTNKDGLEEVLKTLKNGITGAGNTVIAFDETTDMEPDKTEWLTYNSTEGLEIPIGFHADMELRSLGFGEKFGAHHALIAGQIGSGKSSLLHTIIMSALLRYSSDELNIYLVDFKQGVEFKIYANYLLPTFKAVVIESEREFGHSLVEHLSKEISRRAELFRRNNVDDVQGYRRKNPNEKLPRILMIIDEFHVLFSKDNDKLSKESAPRLEQLIRQGRAYGIHVILASQTIANMSGIGQEVFGQIGVRIALKCTKDDARFILGPDNDGVDLLSPTDPGAAVYNSEAGNPVKNTIFRVAYLEQKKQESLLDNISTKLLEKRGDTYGKVPDTRIMLSNVDDNIYHPFQEFYYEDRFDKTRLKFKDNEILIGEPLMVVNNMKILFDGMADEDPTSNMLIVGNDEHKARTMFAFSALSLVLGALSKNKFNKINANDHRVYIVDFAPEDDEDNDALLLLARELGDYVKYVDFRKSKGLLKEFHDEIIKRKPGSGEHDKKYLFLFGLQRARDLRSNNPYQTGLTADDSMGDGLSLPTAQKQLESPFDIFTSIVRSRTDSNVHTVAWVDSFKTFMLHYSAMLGNFDMRIGFTMPDEDSLHFIEEPNGSQISENGAIYSFNKNQKFRPYKKPDFDWLREMCNRINMFD
jgi:hypothetical protein